ncbi:MAG TPA: hypothetical protein VGD69_27100 [Herpetosiphonaceae bacterium]
MYCPQCATHLAATATRCHECNLDVQQIGRILRHAEPAAGLAGQMQRWRAQRRSLGTLLVMCSLLVGCLIPISIGLFREFEALSSIVVGLAGLAGLVLVIGSMLLMAADGAILTGDDQSHSAAEDRSSQREHKHYATSR